MTTDVCDLVIAIGTYEKDGRTRSRNVVLGRVKESNGRLWCALTPHLLNTLVASDNRRAAKSLGIGDGQECSASFLAKDGRPWSPSLGSSNGSDSESSTSTSTAQDDIDF